MGGLVFEAIRLVMVQKLLSGAESTKEPTAKTSGDQYDAVDAGRASDEVVETIEMQEDDDKERGMPQGFKASTQGYKMDPLVSLYYFAPVCAVMNFLFAMVVEIPSFEVSKLYAVGPWILVANGSIAFLLNLASLLLVRISDVPFSTRRLLPYVPHYVHGPQGFPRQSKEANR
jgi:hypothetical protein